VTRWSRRARSRIWPNRSRRGRSGGAKTDRDDVRWLRELLAEGRLPEAWIPPEHVREWRSRARLRHTSIDERTQWLQRIQATLFHHGVGGTPEHRSDRRSRAGKLTWQGSPQLRRSRLRAQP
jgi:hypothetical protein